MRTDVTSRDLVLIGNLVHDAGVADDTIAALVFGFIQGSVGCIHEILGGVDVRKWQGSHSYGDGDREFGSVGQIAGTVCNYPAESLSQEDCMLLGDSPGYEREFLAAIPGEHVF